MADAGKEVNNLNVQGDPPPPIVNPGDRFVWHEGDLVFLGDDGSESEESEGSESGKTAKRPS